MKDIGKTNLRSFGENAFHNVQQKKLFPRKVSLQISIENLSSGTYPLSRHDNFGEKWYSTPSLTGIILSFFGE
jgi:hypothetical protein